MKGITGTVASEAGVAMGVCVYADEVTEGKPDAAGKQTCRGARESGLNMAKRTWQGSGRKVQQMRQRSRTHR